MAATAALAVRTAHLADHGGRLARVVPATPSRTA
jgi:hypothetical protein